jgi:16S rRNA (adenine1518-N6/adenine1519-N6)-dimethyltransferase
VVALDFDRPHPRRAKDEETLKRVVRGAFSHRRKTLLNSLRGSLHALSTEALLEAFGECRIDPRQRAETLSIDDFLCLSSRLASLS